MKLRCEFNTMIDMEIVGVSGDLEADEIEYAAQTMFSCLYTDQLVDLQALLKQELENRFASAQ